MINDVQHIELNAVPYRIAEDMEQPAYVLHRQPLRAPVNGFIQGASGQFQLRPDILEWQMTDWSGGEGYHVFASSTPNRYSLGYNIDPFHTYGTLRLSYHATLIPVDVGDPALQQTVMALARDKLYLVGLDRANSDALIYEYDEALVEWNLVATDSAGTTSDSGAREAWGDSGALFFGGRTADIVSWNGSTFAIHCTACWSVFPGLNGFIYGGAPTATGLTVEEQSAATGGAGTTLYTISEARGAANSGLPLFWDGIAGQNVLYIVLTPTLEETVIYQITPTTSAGAGFGIELVRIPGLRGIVPMYNLGTLYVAGFEGDVPVIFFFDEVSQDLGVIYRNTRRPINHVSSPERNLQEVGGGYGGEFTKNHFVLLGGPSTNDGTDWTVMTLDAVTEAVAGGTVISPGTLGSNAVTHLTDWNDLEGDGLGRHSVVFFRGDIFVGISRTQDITPSADGATKTYRLQKGTYTTNTGIMESAVNDFSIADEKILLSLTVNTEPLAANARVVVKYQLDQDGVWLTAGTHDTDGAKSATFSISTGAQTRSFRNLQIRLELDNNSITSVSPIVQSIRAHATVIRGVRTWQLLLDATDEDGQNQARSWSGERLIDNITSASDAGTVVTFRDGYRSERAGEFDEYNVVIDEYRVIQNKNGEGYISVTLREVITT